MKTRNSSSIPSLREGSRNTSLLLEAANDFAGKRNPSAKDISAFQELFYTLALKSTNSERRQIAQALSRCYFTPRSIAYYFCLDTLEVAAPVLRYSPVLKDRDFVSLVLRSDIGHTRVIAQRDDLELPTVNAIIAVDNDDQVLIDLMRASSHLMGNKEIQQTLDRAKGIASTHQVASSAAFTPSLLQADDATDLSEALLNLASIGGKTGRKIRAGKSEKFSFISILEERLLRHAKDLNFEALAYSIERECRLSSKFIISTLEAKNAGDFATVLAGLEISQLVASRLMLMLIPDLGRNPEIFRMVFESYRKLVPEECRGFLVQKGARFDTQNQIFKTRRQNTLPYGEVHAGKSDLSDEMRAA